MKKAGAVARIRKVSGGSYPHLLELYQGCFGNLDLGKDSREVERFSWDAPPWRDLAAERSKEYVVILFAEYMTHEHHDYPHTISRLWDKLARSCTDDEIVATLCVKIVLNGSFDPELAATHMEPALARGAWDWVGIARGLAPEPDHNQASRFAAWAGAHGVRGLVDYLAPRLATYPEFAQEGICKSLALMGDAAIPAANQLIGDENIEARRAGAFLFRYVRDPSTIPRLERAVNAEKTKKLKDLLKDILAMLRTLDDKQLSSYATSAQSQAVLDARLAAGAVGPLSLQRESPLPLLHWSSGAELSDGAANALLLALSRLEGIPPSGDDAAVLSRHLSGSSRAALLDALVGVSRFDPSQPESRWITFAIHPLASPDRYPELVKRYLQRAAEGDVDEQFVYVLGAAPVSHARKAELLEQVIRGIPDAAVRFAGWKALARVSEAAGAAGDELEEMRTERLGFDARGRLAFPFGNRVVSLMIGQDQALVVEAGPGEVSKSLPRKGKADDAGQIAAHRDRFEALGKAIGEMTKAHGARLERALVMSRTWPAWRWTLVFLEHPILFPTSRTLVFEHLSAGGESLGYFVVDADKVLRDTLGEPRVLGDDDKVRLAHPLRMAPGQAAQLAASVAEAGLTAPVQQLDRPVFPKRADAFRLAAERVGPVPTIALRAQLEELGYRRGVADEEHREVVVEHSRHLGQDDFFTIAHSPIPVRASVQRAETTEIRGARFERGKKPVPDDDVDPVVYSEMMLEFRRLLRLEG